MAKISKVVLDVLKPSEKVASTDFVLEIAELEGTDLVDLKVEELDKKVETVILLIEGKDLNLEKIREIIESSGASLHSIDRIQAKGGAGCTH